MQGRKPTTRRKIVTVPYAPRARYGFDIEVVRASRLRRRAPPEHWNIPQRIDFQLLLCVERGHFVHTLDFTSVTCRPGSILLIHPGQVHVWDMRSDWEGWVLVARSEAMTALASRQADAANLPALLQLDARAHEAVIEILHRMNADSGHSGDRSGAQRMLRAELDALLLRLLHYHRCMALGISRAPALASERFAKFRDAVERNFMRLHSVDRYAALLGCSEKTLQRAVMDCAQISAKELVSQRLALEAKRLLVHGRDPVFRIAEQLGFTEATNFAKFFRRTVGMTPGEFRNGQVALHQNKGNSHSTR